MVIGSIGEGAVIAITIKAIDEFSSTFGKAEQGITGLSQRTTLSITAITTAGIAAVGVMGSLVKEAAIAGDQQEAFNKVVGKEGPEMLKLLQKETLGTIDKFKLMSVATTAVNRGIEKQSIPLIAEFAQRLSDADPQFRDVIGTMNDLTTAIATGRTQTLARMGIDIDSKTIISEYAAELVKQEEAFLKTNYSAEMFALRVKHVTDNMSEAQKNTALQTEIMTQLEEKMKTLPESTTDAADAMAQLQVQFTEARIELGEALSPAFLELLEQITPMIPTIKELVVNLLPLSKFILQIAEYLLYFLNQGIEAVTYSLKGWKDMIITVIDAVKTLINWVKELIDTMKKVTFGTIDTISTAVKKSPTKKVNDAIITPSGEIIETNPRDYIIATKNPGMGGININIENIYGLNPEDISRALSNELATKISI